MARHKSNLNYQYKLNTKLIYDFMEARGHSPIKMAELVGCHKQTFYNFCKNQRIPSNEIFNKLLELMDVAPSEILIPLTIGGFNAR